MVIELGVESAGSWIAIVVGLTVIIGALWRFGKVVHGCFDKQRTETAALRAAVEDLRDKFEHESELQRYRHIANQAAIGEQREKVAMLDADLNRARLDIAANTALLHRVRPT